jgi:hypothetical protein
MYYGISAVMRLATQELIDPPLSDRSLLRVQTKYISGKFQRVDAAAPQHQIRLLFCAFKHLKYSDNYMNHCFNNLYLYILPTK